MKLNKFLIFLVCIGFFSYISCSDDDDIDTGNDVKTDDIEDIINENFKTNTKDTLFTDAVSIIYSTEGVTVDNPFEDKGVLVTENNGDVTITSTIMDTEINYVLSGSTVRGSMKIYSNYKFGLNLNGVSIVNREGAAINIQSGKKVAVRLVGGTSNRLVDGNSYVAIDGEDLKAAFFSEGQLVFDGNGSLLVKGRNKHAIGCDDYIRIKGGNITVSGAISDGVHAADYFRIDGGILDITSGKDGIEVDKGHIIINDGCSVMIKSSGDGILTSYNGTDATIIPYIEINGGTISATTDGVSAKAIKSRGNLTINGGDITVKTTEEEAEGIESKDVLTINGGTILIDAHDDGMNASNHIEITGGSIYCVSKTNDAIDSNGTISISGGIVIASGGYSPETGIDCDYSQFKITGGIVIGVGGTTSTPTADVSTQHSLIYNIETETKSQLIHIESADEKETLTFNIPRDYPVMALLFSSPNMTANTNYTIYMGGSVSGGNNFNGLYTGATYVKGTAVEEFTTSSMVTTIGKTKGPEGGRPDEDNDGE